MLRLGLPIALGGFFLDQATKWWVLNHVMNPPQVIRKRDADPLLPLLS